jgi:hypothetical protein
MWVLDYWEYIASDMSRFHGIRYAKLGRMWPGEFFSLAALLLAYEGGVAGRHAKLKEDEKLNDPAVLAQWESDGIIERG